MYTQADLPMLEKRKKRMASRARLQYHTRMVNKFQDHLKQGTYPKHMKLSPYPKMKTVQGQALIHEACEEVKKIMLIQMTAEEQQTLAQERDVYNTLKSTLKQKKVEKPLKQVGKTERLQKELIQLRATVSKLVSQKDIINHGNSELNQSTQYGELDGVVQDLSEQVFSPQITSESPVTEGHEYGESSRTHRSRTDPIDGRDNSPRVENSATQRTQPSSASLD